MSLSFLASREETRRTRFLEGGNFRVRSRGSLALPYFTITTTLTIIRSLETDPYCGKVRGSIVGRQKSPEVGYSARSWSNLFPGRLLSKKILIILALKSTLVGLIIPTRTKITREEAARVLFVLISRNFNLIIARPT